jgi:hypothetical protein
MIGIKNQIRHPVCQSDVLLAYQSDIAELTSDAETNGTELG